MSEPPDPAAGRTGRITRRRLAQGLGSVPLLGAGAYAVGIGPISLKVTRHRHARIAPTLSGHTHGGQVRLFGYAPVRLGITPEIVLVEVSGAAST